MRSKTGESLSHTHAHTAGPSVMTAKTLDKVAVSFGGFVHPGPDNVFSVEDMSGSLPPSAAVFTHSELGHYEPVGTGPGESCTSREAEK